MWVHNPMNNWENELKIKSLRGIKYSLLKKIYYN